MIKIKKTESQKFPMMAPRKLRAANGAYLNRILAVIDAVHEELVEFVPVERDVTGRSREIVFNPTFF